ncbi:hypothetical protein D3C79_792270 [compost metagenome]
MLLIVLDQADHHEFHGQLRRFGVGAHQVEAGQFQAAGLQQVGKGHRAALEADQGNPEVLQVLWAEATEGEAFLAHVLAAEPGIGNEFELIHRRLAWLVHLKAEPVAATAVPGVAQVFHFLALGFEVKALEIDPGFFAQFDRGQADVHIEGQVLGPDLVEHRAGVMYVAQVAELPDHFCTLVGRPDGVV